jgi:hypothetical protein
MTRQQGERRADTASRIPRFTSREEEAAWWDTHDFTDYLDELKPVRVRFAKNLSQGLTVRLDPDTMRALREQAKRRGIGPTTLIRMWVMERLRAEASQPTP